MFLRKRKKLPRYFSPGLIFRRMTVQIEEIGCRSVEDIAPESNIAAVFHIPESLVDTADHIAHEHSFRLLTLLIDEAVQHVADRMEAPFLKLVQSISLALEFFIDGIEFFKQFPVMYRFFRVRTCSRLRPGLRRDQHFLALLNLHSVVLGDLRNDLVRQIPQTECDLFLFFIFCVSCGTEIFDGILEFAHIPLKVMSCQRVQHISRN